MSPDEPMPLLESVSVRDFRSVVETTLRPSAVCALIGEAQAGKSNLLAGIRLLLDPSVAIRKSDLASRSNPVDVSARLDSGHAIAVTGTPAAAQRSGGPAPPVVFLPAEARIATLLPKRLSHRGESTRVEQIFRESLRAASNGTSSTTPALALGDAVAACCARGVHGTVLLVEEPELYLRPQAQRYLYRLFRRFAAAGNQVIYSTHSPAFLNVSRLDELVFVERPPGGTTSALEPDNFTPDADFRVLSEFDAERAELLLARAAVLVEGQTEKLALPLVFEALGIDPDLAGISIVECGGKWNIPLFAGVCRATGIPCVAVFDRDAQPGRRPSAANRAVAARIRQLVGADRAVELAPDFERVAGVRAAAHGKPERAWRHFASLAVGDVPPDLARIVHLAGVAAAGPDGDPRSFGQRAVAR